MPAKTHNESGALLWRRLFSILGLAAVAAMALCIWPANARGQIYVTNAFADTIGKYGLDGSPVAGSLVTGLSFPFDIAVYGDNIYVANLSSGVVGKYETDGTVVNASLITGFPGLSALAAADSNISPTNRK